MHAAASVAHNRSKYLQTLPAEWRAVQAVVGGICAVFKVAEAELPAGAL